MEAGYHIEFSDDMISIANDGLNVNPLANFNSKLRPPTIRFWFVSFLYSWAILTGLSWLSANGESVRVGNAPVSGSLESVALVGARLYSNVEKYSPFGSLTGKKGYMEIAVRITLFEPSPPSRVLFWLINVGAKLTVTLAHLFNSMSKLERKANLFIPVHIRIPSWSKYSPEIR